jgi:hypothetical protein
MQFFTIVNAIEQGFRAETGQNELLVESTFNLPRALTIQRQQVGADRRHRTLFSYITVLRSV